MKQSFFRIGFWTSYLFMLGGLGLTFEATIKGDTLGVVFSAVVSFIVLLITALLFKYYAPLNQKNYSPLLLPMRFHKFYCFVRLPISLLFCSIELISTISEAAQFFNVYYIVDILYYLLSLILLIVCATGIGKRRKYAWYCIMYILLADLVYIAILIFVCAVTNPYALNSSRMGALSGVLWINSMIFIYYYKRKKLFSINTQEIEFDCISTTEGVIENGVEEPVVEVKAASELHSFEKEIKFCRKCGFELSKGSNFCSSCGARVQVVKEK